MFEYEKTIAERLEAAGIPGLEVKVSADVPDAKFKVLMKPTAVVHLGDETTLQSNARAVASEVYMHVYLVLRGAMAVPTQEDRFYREEIFQALHGETLPGLNSELQWVSTVADYEENIRTYLLTFAAKHTKRKRSV